MSINWMRRMRDAGVPPEQAEAIASMPEDHYLTREYLDGRLEAMEHHIIETLTTRLWQIAALVVVLTGIIVGLLNRFVHA